jgi:hypothetical protein
MRAAEAARTANTSRSGSFRVTINTYFHILQLADGTGRVTNSQVTRQMSVLNAAYASSGFSFRLRATRRTTVTAEEFRAVAGSPGAPSPVELAIKQARRVGGAATLNIYTWDLSAEDLLGFAKFPVWYATTEDGATLDGVVVTYQSLPGGTAAPTNLGDTLVHEVRGALPCCGVGGSGWRRAHRGAGRCVCCGGVGEEGITIDICLRAELVWGMSAPIASVLLV